jgi:outer membrane autotransporter protein
VQGDQKIRTAERTSGIHRVNWLIAACILTPLSLGISEPALAQCSGLPGSVDCTTGGNNYTSGINVGNTGTPTNVTLEPGVQVFITPGSNVDQAVAISTGTGPGIGLPATLTANNAAVTINSPGALTSALFLHPILGSATITASGIMNVAGTGNTNAIWAAVFSSVPGDAASVTYTGAAAPGVIDINATGGSNSTVIQACANAGCGFGPGPDGNATITATGNLTGVFGNSGFGLDAVAGGNGTATVTYNGGTINLTGGSFSSGIFASGGGDATITTMPGTAVTLNLTSTGSAGIEAFSGSGATLANVQSTIQVTGPATPPVSDLRFQPTGIRLQSNAGGSAEVDYTGPGITVHGGGGQGISAISRSGSVTVNASGPIVADGSDAVGILADSGTLRNAISGGNPPALTTGLVQVTASNVSTPGQYGTAISANGGSGGVTVNTSGSIIGGWQATAFTSPATPLLPGRPPASVTPLGNISSISGLPAAGVFLSANGAGTAMLTNNGGSIGALSDLAIVGNSGNAQVTNNGTITGFVKFTGDNNNIVNNGTFNLRHFADTTGNVDASGNGVRDTVRVAVSDLGPGTFTNNGTLTLPAVTGATTLDSTGQYLPLGNPNNAMALGGPLQGHLIGVTMFSNSGIIDLQSNPAAGDVLVITGARQAGMAGLGTFISNGGSLKLDTVLNEGGAATQSDTLVVDGTSVGPQGATQTFIRNAGGAGALTVGDGILVVEVLDKTRSAVGAFSLGNVVEAGPFDYRLFQGGFSPGSTGNWYLRNDFGGSVQPPIPPIEPPNPLPPTPPPEPLPPGVAFPIIGPRLATYGVVQPLARQLGLDILGTLHERGGDTFEPDCVATAAAAELPTKKPAEDLPTKKPGPALVTCPLFSPSVWGRFFGGTLNDRYQAFADPRADGNFWGFQGGIDLLRGSLIAGHYERAGLFAAYGNTNANVDGLVTNPAATAYILARTGSVNLDAWSGGAYWTHVGPSGWYLDGVLQGTSYSGHATTPFTSLPSDGWGFLGSLEAGYPIPLRFWPRLVLEPQAQIIWQHVEFSQKFDGIETIGLGSTSGWTGRLGLLAQSTIVTDSGQVWQPYVRANLWQDWGANAATTFHPSPIQVPLKEGATRLEFAGGATVKVNPNWSFFGQAGYQFAVAQSNVRRNGFTGNIGLRYTW